MLRRRLPQRPQQPPGLCRRPWRRPVPSATRCARVTRSTASPVAIRPRVCRSTRCWSACTAPTPMPSSTATSTGCVPVRCSRCRLATKCAMSPPVTRAACCQRRAPISAPTAPGWPRARRKRRRPRPAAPPRARCRRRSTTASSRLHRRPTSSSSASRRSSQPPPRRAQRPARTTPPAWPNSPAMSKS